MTKARESSGHNNGLAFGPDYDIMRSEEFKGTKEKKGLVSEL